MRTQSDEVVEMPDPAANSWHSLTVENVLQRLNAGQQGLASDEADKRLQTHGPNALPAARRQSPIVRLLRQFNNLLIYILLFAGVITALLDHWIDSGVILAVVIANAIIGYLQEGKAEQALDAVRSLLSLKATVLRDGERRVIAADRLVPGDVVFIEAGDRVPADLRLIRVKNLQIEEAALTGESVPVEKRTDPTDAAASLGDRHGMAYSGTLVTYGQAEGVVAATGLHTEIGRISDLLGRVESLKTPLLQQMDVFARWLTIFILVLSAATFVWGYFLGGYSVVEIFMVAVGLAVAAIPEGLPAILTVTLAIGVQRMASRNAIIRRLPAVETLGSVSVICSDKTGTLTRNEMTVRHLVTGDAVYDVTGTGYSPEGHVEHEGRKIDLADAPILMAMTQAAHLCSDARLREESGAWKVDGDPTEGALVVAARKAGHDLAELLAAYPRHDVIPFESENRFMATLHRSGDTAGVIYVKGAPERLIEMSTSELRGDGEHPLDRARWLQKIEDLAARGERVLAIAMRHTEADHRTLEVAHVNEGLVLLGLFGLIDPPRDEAIAAVADCHSAGIRVKMITGDHAATARAIAAQLGLSHTGTVLTGADIEQLDEQTLSERVREVDVFARASPEHKLRLVQAIQANGAIVAMTGDGVNDAPALKRADIGIAMGIKGTEAAKEASEMVLADDNFASIDHAVRQGRTAYDNIRKSILFILPTNGGEAMTIMVAIALGHTLPLTPVQILWVNMVTAVTLALALAFEPPERTVMQRPPRARDEAILSPLLIWRTIFVSLIFVVLVFGMFEWTLTRTGNLELARTVTVNTLVVLEIFYLFNVRYLGMPSLTFEGILGTRAVLIAVIVTVSLQVLFTYAPFMHFLFGTVAVPFMDGLVIVALGILSFMIVETEKAISRRIRRNQMKRR